MRLWLKDSERRPDPTPVRTDDRKAVLIGMALWCVALVVMLVFAGPLAQGGHGWWLYTCVAGLVLGVVGLVYTSRLRRRRN
jgi:FtsH-binding integral membrane protein